MELTDNNTILNKYYAGAVDWGTNYMEYTTSDIHRAWPDYLLCLDELFERLLLIEGK